MYRNVRDGVMSGSLLKFFAGAAVAVFALVLLLFATLPNSASPSNIRNSAVEWSYSVVIDAGSTGSRLFLYKYRPRTERELIYIEPVVDILTHRPVVMKINPGLSSFSREPYRAADYIKPLLNYAAKFVPEEKRSYTSLFILATAGMRLLPKEAQDAILANLRSVLPNLTSLQIVPEHIKVIEGKWEGIYSWIAINYILDRFKQDTNSLRRRTVGIVDMGGASVQLAVELNATDDNLNGAVETINLGCKDDDRTYIYRLYVTTFLGYGVNEGLRKYEQKLSDSMIKENGSKAYIRDPCLPTNLVKTVNRKDGSNFVRKGYGDWETCLKDLISLLTESISNSDCYVLKCFLGLVRAPEISLSTVELYGFGEYWFSLDDVLSVGGPYNFTEMSSKARDFCRLKWSVIQTRHRSNLYPKANDERLRTQCFKSAWITAMLHSGFSLDKFSNRFQSVFNVNGQEVHWALGAVLYHMRFFPLRETIRRKLQKKTDHHLASWSFFLFWVLFVTATAIVSFIFKQGKDFVPSK